MSTVFKTKQIALEDGIRNILVQNSNGPCSLLAIVNALLLKVDAHSAPEIHHLVALVNNEDQGVSLEVLLENLRDIAIANTRQFGYEQEELQLVLGFLPHLNEGLDLNPVFTGGFTQSKEMLIFKVFNLDIVHGWIITPEDAEYGNVVKYESYENAQNVLIEAYEVSNKQGHKDDVDLEILEDSNKIKHFFARTATQLTDYGLQYLKKTIPLGEIKIFFRNNHFMTIVKDSNDIYQLVTDAGFEDRKDYVWESLLSINGLKNSFFTGKFQPIVDSPTQGQNPFETSGSPQLDDDHALALQMQQEEDERTAGAMQRSYQRNQDKNKKKDKKDKKDKKIKKDKKDKKCIIM